MNHHQLLSQLSRPLLGEKTAISANRVMGTLSRGLQSGISPARANRFLGTVGKWAPGALNRQNATLGRLIGTPNLQPQQLPQLAPKLLGSAGAQMQPTIIPKTKWDESKFGRPSPDSNFEVHSFPNTMPYLHELGHAVHKDNVNRFWDQRPGVNNVPNSQINPAMLFQLEANSPRTPRTVLLREALANRYANHMAPALDRAITPTWKRMLGMNSGVGQNFADTRNTQMERYRLRGIGQALNEYNTPAYQPQNYPRFIRNALPMNAGLTTPRPNMPMPPLSRPISPALPAAK